MRAVGKKRKGAGADKEGKEGVLVKKKKEGKRGGEEVGGKKRERRERGVGDF